MDLFIKSGDRFVCFKIDHKYTYCPFMENFLDTCDDI